MLSLYLVFFLHMWFFSMWWNTDGDSGEGQSSTHYTSALQKLVNTVPVVFA